LLSERRVAVDRLFERAAGTIERRLESDRRRVERYAASLEALSPLRTLARGFSVTQAAPDGPALIDASKLAPGDRIVTRLAQGRIVSRVEEADET
jgi:exodeoxyribonuclease VII large subunit